MNYECCICKNTVSNERSNELLDPYGLILVTNINQNRENHKEQEFFCHFECFRRLVNNDAVMYIMEPDFATIGELDEEGD